MAAPKENQFWKLADYSQRNKKYTPEELWDKFVEYQDWVHEHPLFEEKAFMYKGEVITHSTPKMRAMTQLAFRLFAGISHPTWESYKKEKEYLTITKDIQQLIYTQKLEGAAAELLNPNLIARELNLYDSVKNVDNRPAVHVHTNSPDELKKLAKGK